MCAPFDKAGFASESVSRENERNESNHVQTHNPAPCGIKSKNR